jgi:DNA repair protein RecN (Recombination protein N)
MLRSLAIRNLVLIDSLDLAFGPGLTVLTGETGAGKSILLDGLGLALGERGDSGLIRAGAESASAAAEFELEPGHPATRLLSDHGMTADDGRLVLRRVMGGDGRSRAFVNDQPASVGLLRQLGTALVEVEGQFAEQGLLDTRNHRAILDSFGKLDGAAAKVKAAYQAWRQAEAECESAERALAEARGREEQLRAERDELAALDPRPGEEAALSEMRTTLMHREQLVEAMNAAEAALGADGAQTVGDSLRAASRAISRVAAKAAGRLDEALAALDRAAVEVAEAETRIQALGSSLDHDSAKLESAEERLFAIRGLARKHKVAADDLPKVRERLTAQLEEIEGTGAGTKALRAAADAARKTFVSAAGDLSARRTKAAAALDRAVAKELAPLKLERSRFATKLAPLAESGWTEHGAEQISFEVSTNPGTPFGPITRIASGGELARFLLALKVAASDEASPATLVFDEVDRGIGGAVAAAVGQRLSRLGQGLQVLVVTHSAQVAAQGRHHLRVTKQDKKSAAAIDVAEIAGAARQEEIARMISGARITDEARAAAGKLLDGALAPATEPA